MEDDTEGSEYHPDDDLQDVDVESKRSSQSGQKPNRHTHPEPAQANSVADRSGSTSKAKLTKYLNKDYLDLLNADITNVSHDDSAEDPDLFASQVGASFWSSTEKNAFFRQLSLTGPGDLNALSNACGSKSAPEIQAYILLLQEGVREVESSSKTQESFTPDDAPAACEVSQTCEDAANLAAAALAERVEADDAKRARDQYGDWWLIDETVAGELEDLVEDENPGSSSTEAYEEPADHGEDAKEAQPDQNSESEDNSSSKSELPVPAAAFLKPAELLNLSRSLFMNSATDHDLNWHTHIKPDNDQEGPSIYRSAFDDFHNLAVSITRRLVQASIFQALSRLRSASDSRLVPAVNAADVNAVVDIVGTTVDRARYWATTARRCGVDVYSESDRFKDGRPGTKRGFKLSYDEVEQELGLQVSRYTDEAVSERALDELAADEDAFTDASEQTASLEADKDMNDSSDEEDPSSEPPRERRSSNVQSRKRALSPEGFARAEDKYIEQLDHFNGATEENQLREILGLEPLKGGSNIRPTLPYKRARTEQRSSYWRDTVQYEAPWEQQGIVPMEAFEEMGKAGERSRRRREAVRRAWEQRESSNGPRSPEGETDGEDDASAPVTAGSSDVDAGAEDSGEDLSS